jgi:hypothetical protein
MQDWVSFIFPLLFPFRFVARSCSWTAPPVQRYLPHERRFINILAPASHRPQLSVLQLHI